jgi:protein-tyrosine phosphatase
MTKPRLLATAIGGAGGACATLALAVPFPLRWLLLWTALACGLVACAYLANRPGVYGKRDGRLSWWRALPVLPYLIAYRIAVWVRDARRRYATFDEVAPGLYVGARIDASRLPPGTELVVDLTSEVSEPEDLRRHTGYRGLPVLDGSVPPDEERFLELVFEMATATGGVYVHCISGRGRAPTAAAAVLIARGVADGPGAAFELLRKGRPVVKPTRGDVWFVERIAARLAGA